VRRGRAVRIVNGRPTQHPVILVSAPICRRDGVPSTEYEKVDKQPVQQDLPA
jgi:hypothetical protein